MVDSSTIAVTSISHFVNALDKEFLDIQATIQHEFTLKCKCDMTTTYSHMNRKGKHSQHSSIIWPICLNGLVFFDKLSSYRFESCCIHLNIRFCSHFEQSVSWESGNYRTSIHSEMHICHDENNSQICHGYTYSQRSLIIWSIWLNG